MQAGSSTPSTPTVTAAPTNPAAPEPLDVLWIGEPQGVEQKLPGIAPHLQVFVSDSVSAVEALQSGSAHADVVVIDTTTPGVDTQGILLRMKAAEQDLPVLLVTTSGSGRLISDASQLATCDVVVNVRGFEQQLPAALSQVRARHDLASMLRESRQSQDRLRTILEFQPAVMAVIGPGGVFSAVNQAGLSLLGADQEHVVGRSFAGFLPPDEREDLLDLARRACSGEPCTLDHTLLRADSSRVDVRTQAVPFQNTKGNVALVTVHERSGPSAEELARLTGQFDALSSELAETAAALNVERQRCSDLIVEMATTKSMLEQSSRLQTLLETDHESMERLREQLRRFAGDADRLCAGIIERQQGALAGLEDVADPTR